MRTDYYNMYPYGSTAMGGYDRRYGADSYMEYDRHNYHPDMYKDDMHRNYQHYTEQVNYAPKEISRESLNDTLENIVNTMAMLKREASSPEELDLIKRYIVTINQL